MTPDRIQETPYTAEWVREMFTEYQRALRTLAASHRTVEERKAAIGIRDEFEAGTEGHIATLLAALSTAEDSLKVISDYLKLGGMTDGHFIVGSIQGIEATAEAEGRRQGIEAAVNAVEQSDAQWTPARAGILLGLRFLLRKAQIS